MIMSRRKILVVVVKYNSTNIFTNTLVFCKIHYVLYSSCSFSNVKIFFYEGRFQSLLYIINIINGHNVTICMFNQLAPFSYTNKYTISVFLN